jgi:hypothetical protein
VLVAATLIGAINAPAALTGNASAGQDPASTTQVTTAPAPDALRWYDEADRRGRADVLGREYAVSLPSVAVVQIGPPSVAAVPGGPLGVPAALWTAYQSAARAMPASCNLDPRLLAAIGQIESGSLAGRTLDARHRAVPPVFGPVLDGAQFARIPDTDRGRWDGDRTWDRAVGPMQFIPSTWARHGVDADGDGAADPQDIEDAAQSAAGYLCAGGRDLSKSGDLRAAILSYNHSTTYLAAVLALIPRVSSAGDLVLAGGGVAPGAGGGYLAPAAPSVRGPGVSAAPSSATRSPSSTATASPTSTSTPSSTTSTASPTTSSTTTATQSPTATETASPTSTATSTTSTTTSTTTSPTSTTTSTTTTSTTTPPTSTTTTPDGCPTDTPTESTTTATESPTETATPTPTDSCTTSPASTPSPSTSSATATEAALEASKSDPTAD